MVINLKQLMIYKPCEEGLTFFKKLKKNKDSRLTDLKPEYYLWGCQYFPEHIDIEYFNFCVKEEPYYALEYCFKLLSKEQLEYCFKKEPFIALYEYMDFMDKDIFEYCVKQKPFQALALVLDKLTKEQLEYCIKKAPYAALAHARQYLTVSEFMFCIKQRPSVVKFTYCSKRLNVRILNKLRITGIPK